MGLVEILQPRRARDIVHVERIGQERIDLAPEFGGNVHTSSYQGLSTPQSRDHGIAVPDFGAYFSNQPQRTLRIHLAIH